MAADLTLYDNFASVAAQKARLALHEKQLQWSAVQIDLRAGDMLDPAYLKLNPNGVVPTLVHDGRVIVESTVIAEYLDEVFPLPALKPDSAFDRARMRVWTKRVDEEVHRATGIVSMAVYIRPHYLDKTPAELEAYLARLPDPDRAARQRETITRGIDAPIVHTALKMFSRWIDDLDRALAQSPWLLGDRFTLADIACIPYVTRLEMLAMADFWAHGRRPHLARWWAAVQARESYRRQIEARFPATARATMRARGESHRMRIRTLMEDFA